MKLFEAKKFCIEAHESIQQKRKYSGEPYWVHPIEVSEMVAGWGLDEAAQIAALLHDVPEDVFKDREEEGIRVIRERFGSEIAEIVFYCTEISKHSDGKRKERKRIDHQHYANGCSRSQAIKIADAISNLASIKEGDPNFFAIYFEEKKSMVKLFERAPDEALDAWKKFCRRINRVAKP